MARSARSGAEVVALVHRARRLDRVVVAVERGHELVRLAAVEPVPAVEPAAERPGAAIARHVGLVVGREVPLAHRVGRVALVAEDLGEEPVGAGDVARVPGVAGREVGDPAHAVAVVVAAGEQARARRRAERRGVEVREPHTAGREAVDVGGGDVGAVAADLREADVVEHDEQHVGCVRRRFALRWPPRLGVAEVPADDTAEFRLTRHARLLTRSSAGQDTRIGSSSRSRSSSSTSSVPDAPWNHT